MLYKLDSGCSYDKPKNYGRKNSICKVTIPIVYYDTIVSNRHKTTFEYVDISYEIEMNTTEKYNKPHNDRYGNRIFYNWAKFKNILTYPALLDKLCEDDYYIQISNFHRDNVLVPYVAQIEIRNLDKYETLKKQMLRKSKIKNINFNN